MKPISSDFDSVFKEMIDLNEAFFQGRMNQEDHANQREDALSRALIEIAKEHGVELKTPLQIDELGEIRIAVAQKSGETRKSFGKQFANLLNPHSPRTGPTPGVILNGNNSWCVMAHFKVEKLIQRHGKLRNGANVINQVKKEMLDLLL